MRQEVQFDPELIRRYDTTGPRYTSYPTAVSFEDTFDEPEFVDCALRSNEDPIPKPLSLYVHIPFCDTVCFYCACNKIATKDQSRVEPYLEHLKVEARRVKQLFDPDRHVEQLHFGGGTPTYLNNEQLDELVHFLRESYEFCGDEQGEFSIEVDPRKISAETIQFLRRIGFNRLSIGVQDFDLEVQEAVNRIQPQEKTQEIYDAARNSDFKSINFDLIYGLPFQSVASFAETVDKVIAMRPDRIAVFNYAHLPHIFKPQRRINDSDLPEPSEKLAILQMTIERLVAVGYLYLGMDHFALPDDELAVAQRNGSLYRNFQGFSAHAECDLIALGVSAISRVGDCYAQNVREIEDYYSLVAEGRIPISRGIRLTTDDILRREIINSLICYSFLDFTAIENRFGVTFESYFATELEMLKPLDADGLVQLQKRSVEVTPIGRLLARNVAMVFDKRLRTSQNNQRFSRVI